MQLHGADDSPRRRFAGRPSLRLRRKEGRKQTAFVMLNEVKHLSCAKHTEEDPSLLLRMTKKRNPLFPPQAKRGMASEAMPG